MNPFTRNDLRRLHGCLSLGEIFTLAFLCASLVQSTDAMAQATDAGPSVADAASPVEATVESPANSPAIPAAEDADVAIVDRLRKIFAQVESFEQIEVVVSAGVVHLSGAVQSREISAEAAEIAKAGEGVAFVDNKISTSMSVAHRITPIRQRTAKWTAKAIEMAPLIGVALIVFLVLAWIGRVLSRRDWIIEKLVKRAMLRDIFKRAIRLVFYSFGLLVALEILDATKLVGTILGAAGVLGLAAGFAFRDIAENYLASLLLAARRPFVIGDSVQIGEFTGKVMRLTMRETVVMTFEGNHLTIPNAQVFKAPVLNYERNPRRRLDFVVGAGVDTDLVYAQKMGVQTLLATPGVLDEPSPFVLVEELGDSNVAVRLHAWVDQKHADFSKVRSAAIRRVKVAFEDAGIDLPEPIYRVRMRNVTESAPVARAESSESHTEDDVSPDETIEKEIAAGAATDAEQGEENLLTEYNQS